MKKSKKAMTSITITIPTEKAGRLKVLGHLRCISVSSLLEPVIDNYLAEAWASTLAAVAEVKPTPGQSTKKATPKRAKNAAAAAPTPKAMPAASLPEAPKSAPETLSAPEPGIEYRIKCGDAYRPRSGDRAMMEIVRIDGTNKRVYVKDYGTDRVRPRPLTFATLFHDYYRMTGEASVAINPC